MTISLLNCEEKPDTELGMTDDEKAAFISGLLVNSGFTDSGYGTVIDQNSNLEFKKCSQGNTYDGSGCTTGQTVTFSFCNSLSNLCNLTSFPMTLIDPGLTTTSEAWDSCAGDATGGFNDWRVASIPELQKIAIGGRAGTLLHFPDTFEGYYWSGCADPQDQSGQTAKAISFAGESFGTERSYPKDNRLYVKCVRERY